MNLRYGLISAVAATALLASAGAAMAVTQTVGAAVTVMSPMTLTPDAQPMQFGSVIMPSNGSANTVTMTSAGVVSIAGAGDGSIVASTTNPGHFTLVGPASQGYNISQSLTFNQTGLTNVSASAATTPNGSVGTIPAGGTQNLFFGGAFTMSPATTVQAYTGTLSVTVTYN